ncbi:MAG: aminoglycoside phosphotransferase family protein [Chloroflexota bacterium]|nr:aminoglycoside phosphotransferase family protein [Chloroflexota bacterium]
MNKIRKVAEQFVSSGNVVNVDEFGNGNINDTYLVHVDDQGIENFILQQINTYVFPRPKLIIHNLRTFTEHVNQRLKNGGFNLNRRWDVPKILPTRAGADFYVDAQDSFWRAISFVKHSHSYDTVQSMDHARETGYALGLFHNLVSDLDSKRMHDTLVGYHIAPQYLQQYDHAAASQTRINDSPLVRYCHQSIRERRDLTSILEDAKKQGHLKTHIIHGDTKVNNILFCDKTDQAISFIDLDTVKPGLIHYDIGDCLRANCNPLGEETTDFDNVHFETPLARSILEGYFANAGTFLTENDYAFIFDAVRLLTFEQGLRFFADYLAGDIYFKVKHAEHNLERAVVQFKLTESIEAQEKELRSIIADLKPSG